MIMAPKDLDKLIEKYMDGRCTREECAYINSLYSALGKKPHSSSPELSTEEIASRADRILRNLASHTGGDTGDKSESLMPEERRSFFWHYTGIAASIVLFLAVGYYFLPGQRFAPMPAGEIFHQEEYTTVENSTDIRKRVILPDGSIVQMSPESRIKFLNDPQIPSRELFLEGEAYFDVAFDSERPFFVYAGDVVTKVLGTSFIVRARGQDEKVTVSVKTGKVTVYSRKATHKKTVLVPNQEAVYDRSTDLVATQSVPVARLNELKQNLMEMHFEETPVSEVLTVLTKSYDIDIAFREESLSGCVLTSSFYEEGLYDRIDVICTAIGATYKIVDARIVIESQGCNLKTQ